MLAWTQRCLWCRYGNQLITLVLKFFLEFFCECNISDCSFLFIFPHSVFSFKSRGVRCSTGRSSARSFVRSSVLSLVVRQSWIRFSVSSFVRSSIVNSFVRLFVRSSFTRRSSIVNSFVRQFVRSFVRRSLIVNSFVRLFVRSFARSVHRPFI